MGGKIKHSDKKCIVCEAYLHLDNKTGYCHGHINRSPHIIAREKKWQKHNTMALKKASNASIKWAKANPGKKNAANAKRLAAKKQRTPKWLTKEQYAQIEQMYILAKELQWLSEELLEVDHIIPIQGKNVSGLHVPWNLQILTQRQNIIKSNKVGINC